MYILGQTLVACRVLNVKVLLESVFQKVEELSGELYHPCSEIKGADQLRKLIYLHVF